MKEYPVKSTCPKCGYEDSIRVESEDGAWLLKCSKCRNLYDIHPIQRYVPREPTVTCPFCHSTDCKKISASAKIGKTLMWGVLAAGTVSKTWHCNSCGSNFG